MLAKDCNEEDDNIKEKTKSKDKKHDKIFKDILQNKKEMSKFINNFIKNRISSNELENYNVNYITKDFKYQQSDIVYKEKEKEIYYLIEHQTKVDYSMSYRILNYCVEIIRNIVENQKINKASYKYPTIIPIVLYTGDKKWTANTSFISSYDIEGISYETIKVNYRLIDVNKYSIEELLKQNTMISNAMILEKCKDKEEVIKNLRKIIKNAKTNEQFKNLKRLVIYLYSDMQEKSKKEILKILEESECEENMSTIAERLAKELRSERKIGISQGISQAIMETIKNMLKYNEDEEKIMKYTNTKKEEIEKIKKELETQTNS